MLHFPSLSISITLVGCMFSSPFSFSVSSYAKSSIPSPSPHYLFSFAHNSPVSPHAVSTPGLFPRYLCHPGQFLFFLSTPSGCLKSSSLFISPFLVSFPWFPKSSSFPLPFSFLSSLLCPPYLHPSAQLPSSIIISSSWGLPLWRSSSHSPLPPHTTFSPLLCLLWLLPELWSPSSSAPLLYPCLSSCFDGAGTNVAQDVISECLPGGLLLCWSVGIHFPPWHRELLS